MIGINWLMLVYSAGIISNLLPLPVWLKVIMSSMLMVLLDFFIEPFAMRYDLWNWENNTVPLKNYAGWFFSGLLMQCLFFFMKIEKQNVVAIWLYACQFIFFTIFYLRGY